MTSFGQEFGSSSARSPGPVVLTLRSVALTTPPHCLSLRTCSVGELQAGAQGVTRRSAGCAAAEWRYSRLQRRALHPKCARFSLLVMIGIRSLSAVTAAGRKPLNCLPSPPVTRYCWFLLYSSQQVGFTGGRCAVCCRQVVLVNVSAPPTWKGGTDGKSACSPRRDAVQGRLELGPRADPRLAGWRGSPAG